CLLAGCSLPDTANVAAAVSATVSQAQADVQNAIDLWGIAKGLAGVAGPVLAATGNPAASAALASVIGTVDPVVSQAQAALDAATTDAGALEALAAQIKAQADALTLTAAPAIKAVPSGVTPS
ncbi:MAG TPA: hypothetical protein VGC16_12620, partial [Rhizomicrobium sp.]